MQIYRLFSISNIKALTFFNKMQNILDRLFLFMDHEKLNPNKITVQAGLSVGLIGKAKKTNAGLNSDSIEKILYAYPNLSADWLLTGRGSMLASSKEYAIKPSRTPMLEEKSSDYNTQSSESERIKELKHTIELQQEIINNLKNERLDRDATGASVADVG